jgi:hypothetical protein
MRTRTPLLAALVAAFAVSVPVSAQEKTTVVPIPIVPVKPIPVERIEVPVAPILIHSVPVVPNIRIDRIESTMDPIAPVPTSRFRINPIQIPPTRIHATSLRPSRAGVIYSRGTASSDVFSTEAWRRGDAPAADRGRADATSFYNPASGWSSGNFFASEWDQSAWKKELTAAPTAARPASYESAFPIVPARAAADRDARVQKAADLAALGVRVDWRRHRFEELVDFEVRASKARALRALGVDADWRRHPFWELSDRECQAGRARELGALGVQVDWRQHGCRELAEMALRIKKARELGALGIEADWRAHDYGELVRMEERARKKRERR